MNADSRCTIPIGATALGDHQHDIVVAKGTGLWFFPRTLLTKAVEDPKFLWRMNRLKAGSCVEKSDQREAIGLSLSSMQYLHRNGATIKDASLFGSSDMPSLSSYTQEDRSLLPPVEDVTRFFSVGSSQSLQGMFESNSADSGSTPRLGAAEMTPPGDGGEYKSTI